ncbi:MAG: hypothetical protein HYR85_07955 [Planctomycetes bacterium]|nr:hypothetical protein [Planctomycetota bacterium]MBI3848173.1 hypothetical protein [Planctomycetota bacterium]
MAPFNLTQSEIDRRKSALEFTTDDEERIRDAHDHLKFEANSIVELLNAYLFVHLHSVQSFPETQLFERLTHLQAYYFTEITAGDWGVDFFGKRLRVGRLFQQISASPTWYLGAYQKYLHFVTASLGRQLADDVDLFRDTVISLTKVAHLDMGLMLDACYVVTADPLGRSVDEQFRHLEALTQRATELIAQELKEPLCSVISFLQTLESDRDELPPAQRELLPKALRRCDELWQLTMKLCDFRTADSGPFRKNGLVYGPTPPFPLSISLRHGNQDLS